MDLVNRRTFARQVGSALAGGVLVSSAGSADAHGTPYDARWSVAAVLFDAFPVFDPRSIGVVAEQVAPGRGAELTAAWRTRQFEYAWLRVVAGEYADFWRCTEDALRYATSSLRIELTPDARDRLLQAHLELRAWPDAPAALRALRDSGVRLGLLSNFTPAMLGTAIRASGLDGVFEHVLSTDRVRTYKPDPRAYQLGVEATGLRRERILFAAFAGWDAAGATRFGYPTFWVNRLHAPAEELGVAPPLAAGDTLAELARFVGATP